MVCRHPAERPQVQLFKFMSWKPIQELSNRWPVDSILIHSCLIGFFILYCQMLFYLVLQGVNKLMLCSPTMKSLSIHDALNEIWALAVRSVRPIVRKWLEKMKLRLCLGPTQSVFLGMFTKRANSIHYLIKANNSFWYNKKRLGIVLLYCSDKCLT